MDYLTLAEFRARTGLTTTQASDDALTVTLNAVEQLIQQYLGFAPQSATVRAHGPTMNCSRCPKQRRCGRQNGNNASRGSAAPITATTAPSNAEDA